MTILGISGVLAFIVYFIIPLFLLYIVVRVAVRHGIESSDIAMKLRKKLDEAEHTKR